MNLEVLLIILPGRGQIVRQGNCLVTSGSCRSRDPMLVILKMNLVLITFFYDKQIESLLSILMPMKTTSVKMTLRLI
jgi:hypothetical protein